MSEEAGPQQTVSKGEWLSLDEAMARALEVHRRGHPEVAAAIYEKILDAMPEHLDAIHYLGVASHQMGKSAEGLALIERAISLLPDAPELHNNRGNVLKQMRRLDDARASYERAISLSPDHVEAMTNLASMYRATGRGDEAIALLRRVLELAPEHVEAHHNLGNALFDMGRTEEALDPFRRALLLKPYEGGSYMRVGAVLAALGRTAEAAELYAKWHTIDPTNPVPGHLLAACTGDGVPPRASDAYVERTFDRFAESFDTVLASLDYQAPALVAKALASVIGPGNASLTVLDAGCGTGLAGPLLRPYAQKLVGIDLSKEMLVKAVSRNIYDDLVHTELAAFLRRRNAAFDAIVSVDTLCYFGDLTDVVGAVQQALVVSGVAVFSLESAEEETAPAGFRLNHHGRYSHTKSYVEHLITRAGLSSNGIESVELRTEVQKPVKGWIVVVKKVAEKLPA